MKPFANWKTTSAGLIMIIGAISSFFFIEGKLTQAELMIQITAILGGLGLLFAKDNNVTGGNKDQGTPPSIIEAPKVIEEKKTVNKKK